MKENPTECDIALFDGADLPYLAQINHGPDWDGVKINSRLIADALELLEALESCIARMAELQEHANYPLAWPRVKAMDTIRKAKGE